MSAYLVIIEWDGERPPRTWYNRLKKFTGGVRVGDKNTSALARRTEEGRPGTVPQEGTVLTASYSCAREVALAAQDCGAKGIQLLPAQHLIPYVATAEDRAVAARVEAVYGKRGRPSAKEQWAVMCYECLNSYSTEAVVPVSCPHCGGFKIAFKRGVAHNYVSKEAGLWEQWLATRFANGGFCVPCVGCVEEVAPPSSSIQITDGDDQNVTTLIAQAAKLQADLKAIEALHSREMALQALDGVFAARTFAPQAIVEQQRMEALVRFMQLGGDPLAVDFARMVDPDILDATYSLSVERVAALAANIHHK